jgi:succinoglycan biosynthesis protein ExoO
MAGSPLISVIIPSYNTSEFIETAIDSVREQSVQDVEILVVDDASTDDSVAVVQSISDPRVRLLQNQNNLGAAMSRNRAIDAARGQWIALLDADDWFLPTRLENLLSAAEKHDADLVADDIYFVPNDVQVDLERGLYENHRGHARPLRRLFRSTHLPLWLQIENVLQKELPGGNDSRICLIKPLIRRSFLEQHGIRYIKKSWGEEDVPFYLDCLGYGARFLLIEGPWYCYRLHPDNISKKWNLEDHQTRVDVNRMLLERPYVQSDPTLERLFLRRQEELENDLAVFRFARQFDHAPRSRKVRLALRSPSNFAQYLWTRLLGRLAHRRAQLRNLPTRLREVVGFGAPLKT